MEYSDAMKKYNARDGVPCESHEWVVETYLGSKTGDEVCRVCGQDRPKQERGQ